MLLRDIDKERLYQIFSSASEPFEIWAYGSRVNGKAHSGSDLDLVIRSRDLRPISLELLLDLKEKIQESHIPILVELRDWARLPESFHRNIMHQYEVIFSNNPLSVNEPETEYSKK